MATQTQYRRSVKYFIEMPGLASDEVSFASIDGTYGIFQVHTTYSLAVVPVMWPSVSEEDSEATLPRRLNPTGSGDMTFGAFVLLAGV